MVYEGGADSVTEFLVGSRFSRLFIGDGTSSEFGMMCTSSLLGHRVPVKTSRSKPPYREYEEIAPLCDANAYKPSLPYGALIWILCPHCFGWKKPSVVTSKAAINGQVKTGH
jgi:hypothetical protein